MSLVRAVVVAAGRQLADGVLALGTAGASALMVVMVGTTPWLGVFLLPVAARLNRALAGIQRARTAQRTGRPVEEAYQPPPAPVPGHGPLRRYLRRVGHAFTDRTTYRDAGWVLLHTVVGGAGAAWTLTLVAAGTAPLWWWVLPIPAWPAVPLPLVALAGAATLPVLADSSARLAATALSPPESSRLARRVTELTATRAAVLDAHEAELRRIERDLHDGAQANLVSSALRLGIAERRVRDDPDKALALLAESREGIEHALTELRGVVRGMYPPVLADRGLEGAIATLAVDGPVPVRVELDGIGRQPAALESAAYHVVAEALTNVAKHSGATRAVVEARLADDTLHLEVRDDGRGGADPDRGSGLVGVRRRVAALDGTLDLSSPAGGPTRLVARLPGAERP
ncbi:sensor histidine kinase [Actinophytocola gossypii]|uniref:histidine kinase n=1 Tax=Actinophytocola gossypii TaxID=2812003 RepID=A0ABT2JA50_9PSEU|nr:sensor histidine kinase [Actinophytocola gossypii]MCT2584745.1 sensor histidine kinase [Actinophytocola gossypii]